MNIKKEIHLIHTDPVKNNNKFWYGTWYEDGRFVSEYGRVGYTGQTKDYGIQSESFVLRKESEKTKKGYTPLKTIKTASTVTVNHDINSVARQQIKVGSPELTALVDRLIKSNIHNIQTSTSITYNSTTGLFQTPLGVVTLDGIEDAWKYLNRLKDAYDAKNRNEVSALFGQYIRLIPHDYGMRINLDSIVTDNFFSKEKDVLDSLRVSYETITTQPTPTTDKTSQPVQKLFDVELDILKDQAEHKRIVDKYYATRKDQHVCRHLKPKNIYQLKIASVVDAYERKGKQLGNHKELWHGTRTANLLSILKSGLRISPPSSVSKAGALFGPGLYFAIDSTKSLNYSYGYWTGNSKDENCFMFLTDVMMGKTFQPRYGQSIPSGYDSSWARANISGVRNDEIITRNEYQANLKYLIEFGK